MGHREDLLEGAKRCLLEKGFVRTTARDIVKESGTNLASIGYHYGSKDALLVQAYVSLVESTGHRFEAGGEGLKALSAPAGSLERFQEVWTYVIRALPESRAIFLLSFELILQGDRLPEVHRMLVEAQKQSFSGLVPLFSGIPEEELDKETIDSEGRFYNTLLQGLMVQWLFDPDSATDADQLTEGLRRVIAAAAKG
ncbi:TetR/AcrR family transcriptional regulator [Streptomyces yaanensis]|uniref:TetR/AcrR family transcriptional regulator n=1 Tax=Streptomyces yaanensis TaxID=1142239 RepID=A0ABV7SGB4_9ACTN|nr:TetR/AcrR family transcriptional regulator [Streptomyces sp. CGMCC 4.7035]WNB97967.1 TetR/AcrR family transcriptional regulator [Streptomyces sp. CGMCC 4.7035]